MNPLSYSAPISLEQWKKLPPHPRLFANEAGWETLRQQVKTDPVSRELFEAVIARADGLLEKPTVIYQKEGRRLLGPARQGEGRIICLSMAARLTGEARYVDRAIQEMRAVAEVKDWNPSHFLDTAEATLGLAVGFDWLYDHLSAEDRERFEQAIIRKGLSASYDPTGNALWWINGINNWNQVCHAGMIAGALAIAPNNPELGVDIVNRALENLPLAAKAYAPNGAYAEGPMYWGYGTMFHVMLTDLLQNSLGSTSDTENFEGFLESADFMAQVTGPSGRFFNYADGVETRRFQPALFWFAGERRQPSIVNHDVKEIAPFIEKIRNGDPGEDNYLFPFALLWWVPGAKDDAASLPLHWVGRGANPVAIHRSAWNDPQAAYLAIKGGRANSPHAHMDAGSFVLEADGERWAVDPGMQNYNSLESKGLKLWNSNPDADRWRIFRLGPEAHNILRFNGENPKHDGFAEIVESESTVDGSQTLVDLSAVYPVSASEVRRGVKLSNEGRMWIQDEWTTRDQSVEVTFQWLTRAAVAISGNELTLTQNGKQLNIRVIAPDDAEIEVEEMSQPRADYDAANPDLRRIAIRTSTAAASSGRFAIHIEPGSLKRMAPLSILPLNEWKKSGN